MWHPPDYFQGRRWNTGQDHWILCTNLKLTAKDTQLDHSQLIPQRQDHKDLHLTSFVQRHVSYSVCDFHILDVVDVQLILQNYNKSLGAGGKRGRESGKDEATRCTCKAIHSLEWAVKGTMCQMKFQWMNQVPVCSVSLPEWCHCKYSDISLFPSWSDTQTTSACGPLSQRPLNCWWRAAPQCSTLLQVALHLHTTEAVHTIHTVTHVYKIHTTRPCCEIFTA